MTETTTPDPAAHEPDEPTLPGDDPVETDDTMPQAASPLPPKQPAGPGKGAVITGLAVMLVLIVGVGVGTYLALQPQPSANEEVASTEEYRADWESAMAKAGVEATLPPEPTDLSKYEGAGTHPFDGIFTAAEATALMRVYPYSWDQGGQTASISNPEIGFPSNGVMSIRGVVTAGDQSGDVRIEGGIELTDSQRLRSVGEVKVSVSGFTLSGPQAKQATDLALNYANAYIIAAPELTIVDVEVVEDGIRVKGQAPNRLERVE